MKVFAFQKNTDLHALSAGTTITNFLKCEKIKKCRRFVFWDIEVATDNQKKWMDQLLAKTYYLLNTNKEDYYLESIPTSQKEGQFHVLVQINNTLFEDQSDLIKKINDKCQTQVTQLKKSLLWDLVVDANSLEEATTYVQQQLLDSAKHPFLLNPIFEKSEILSSTAIISG